VPLLSTSLREILGHEVKALIFDMDGVLINSSREHIKAWKFAVESYGYSFDIDFSYVYGRKGRDIVREIVPGTDEKEIREMEELAERRFREIYKVRSFDDVLPFIEHTKKRGKRTALVTSAPRANIELVLSSLNLEFDAIVSAEDVTKGKPDPEPYLRALEKLGARREECVIFEDSFAGIESAIRAGIDVIGVASTSRREDLERLGIKAIESFSELLV
jgi:HAD superfamily hydrolase (TIGR01509 family)